MYSAPIRYFSALIISFCIVIFNVASAQESHSINTHVATASVDSVHHDGHSEVASSSHGDVHEEAEKKESPVEAIMHHIADANEFHVATIGHNHISIPLPVFVYNKTTGATSFGLSSQYHHEKDGLILAHGRIVDATTHNTDNLLDLSITKNVFTMLLSVLLLSIIFFSIKSAYSKNPGKAPKGIQSFFEPIVNYIIEEVAKPNLGNKYEKFLPYLLSVFFFILFNNLLGLVPFFPGSANASGNIAFTMTLSVLTFLMINFNGNKHYWQHVFFMPGVPKWVLIILTPVEILGLVIKPIALMLRLFANITAGHTIILSLVSLIFILGNNGASVGGAIGGSALAVPFVIFMNSLELLVAFLQAFIFTLLSAIFIGMAIEDHHEAAHH